MMYERLLDLNKLLKSKSFSLFGARSTGKTTLLQQQLGGLATFYDLLDSRVYARLLRQPSLLAEENPKGTEVIVIDEIQKLPQLLDEVHRLIQSTRHRFVLTGSSARKLKRGGASLLAGRAWEARLFPLTSCEIDRFDLVRYLNRGGLPQVYDSDEPQEELQSYVSTYLRVEIQAEAVTRNVGAFSNFLDAIALANGQEINMAGLSSDCQVSPGTLRSYLEILEDTLIGFTLPGYTKTKKRKAISRAKHYLFDLGVVNTLARRGAIRPKSEAFGFAFEHFIILEIRTSLNYRRLQAELCYWRSTSGFEVDVIVGDEFAVEIKATEHVQDKHMRGLRALAEEGLKLKPIVVSMDPTFRKTADGIEIWPWSLFLKKLWQDGTPLALSKR